MVLEMWSGPWWGVCDAGGRVWGKVLLGAASLCVCMVCVVWVCGRASQLQGPCVRACYGGVSVGGSKGLCGCSGMRQ